MNSVGGNPLAAHKSVSFSQASIVTGVRRILIYRLLKVLDCLLQALPGSLVPEVAAFEIELVGLGRFRRESSLLRGSDPLMPSDFNPT